MSITRNAGEQSTSEIRTYPCDFAPDLRDGVSVVAVSATHIPPVGNDPKVVTVQTSGSLALVTLPNPDGLGLHKVSVLADLSDGDKSEILLHISVKY